MKNYCVIVDENFIARLLALHESMERHCQPYHLWVLTMRSAARKPLKRLALPNITVVPMTKVRTAALKAVKSTRTWKEYVWTFKGSWMLYLLDKGLDSLCYMDADGFFFNEPSTLFDEIGDAPLAITLHRRHPLGNPRHGEAQGGFVYAAQAGRNCIEEWAEQSIEWCFQRLEDGRFVDQAYLNAWPKKWGAKEIEHRGVNLAPWNQSQYSYTLRKGSIYVDEYPLVWYHFHRGLKWYELDDKPYRMHKFVREHIYKRAYVGALKRAERRLR